MLLISSRVMKKPMSSSQGLHRGGGGGAGARRRSWGGPDLAGEDRCLSFDTTEGYADRWANTAISDPVTLSRVYYQSLTLVRNPV